MRLIAAAALASAYLASSPLLAADMLESAPPPMDGPVTQTELGTNWYIRGDVGYGETNQATVVPEDGLFPTITNMPVGDASDPVPIVRGNSQKTMGVDIDLGFGYRINDWFRVEGAWMYSQGPGLSTQRLVYCPEEATAVAATNYSTDANGNVTSTTTPIGYQYDYTTCNGNLNVKQYNNTVMAMGYADLGHYGIFTPFIGLGGGLNVNSISGSLTFNQTDTGGTYTGVKVTGSAPAVWVTQSGYDASGNPTYSGVPQPLLPPGQSQPKKPSGQPQPIGPNNWNRSISSTKYSFAVAAAAGLGIKISQSATLDLQYKFMSLDASNFSKNTLQAATIGVRYDLN